LKKNSFFSLSFKQFCFSYYYLLYLPPLLSIFLLPSLHHTHPLYYSISIPYTFQPGLSSQIIALETRVVLQHSLSWETDKGSSFLLIQILDLLLNC
jgi:hypothetical protein